MFYNQTIHLQGDELATAQAKAKGQDKILLEWFELNPFKQITRSGLERLQVLNAPTSSYCRSLNTLEKHGMIKKLDVQIKEKTGKKQHLYCLKIKTELF